MPRQKKWHRYQHGTAASRVQSIKRHGLLPGSVVWQTLKLGQTYNELSRHGVVYLMDTGLIGDSYCGAYDWGYSAVNKSQHAHDVLAILTVDPVVPLEPDANILNNNAREHHGSIPPERVRLLRLGDFVFDPPLPLLELPDSVGRF